MTFPAETGGMVEICSFGIFGPGKWEEREYYFLEGMTFPAETVIPPFKRKFTDAP